MSNMGDIQVNVGANTTSFQRAMREMERSMGMVNQATRQMQQQLQQAFHAQEMGLMGLKQKQMESQMAWFNMAQGMKSYSGTSKQFMAEVTAQGKVDKQVKDEMMKRNEMAKMGFIQSVGAMVNMSGQSEKIAQNFTRMQNPLYQVNNGALRVSQGLEGIARSGQPAVLALKQLGPTANMKQLADHTRMITQGQMRFASVAMASGVATGFMVKGLHGAAMENKGYANSFNTMLSTLRTAFQPMVDVFTQVMTKVYDFITKIGELIIKFNEAHPTIAKFIQGFLMLIPILTLILSPLAVGIGLIGGMQAAFAFLAPVIMPLVTGLMAMSGTVLIVAGAIVALIAIGVLLYKNWDTIKAKSIEVWNAVKQACIQAWEGIKSGLSATWSAIVSAFSSAWTGIVNVATTVWNAVKTAVMTAVSGIGSFLSGAWSGIVSGISSAWSGVASFFSSVWEGIKAIFSGAIAGVISIAQTLLSFFLNYTPLGIVVQTIIKNWDTIKQTFQITGQMIVALWQVAWNAIKSFVGGVLSGIVSVISTAWNAIKTATSTVMNGVKSVFTTVWNSLKGVVVPIVNGIKSAVTTAWNGIKSVTSTVMNGVKSVFSSVWNSLKGVVMPVVNSIKSAVTTAWNGIKSVTSSVFNGVKSVATSVFNSIKSVITSVANSIKSVVTTAWNGIKSVTSTVFNGVKSVATSVFNSIKSTISSVANSIKSVVSTAWNGIKSVTSSIFNSVKSTVSSIFNSIKSTISSVVNGIKSTVSSAFNAVKTAMTKPIEAAKSTIRSSLNAIKGFFSGLHLTIPKPKIPSISVSAGHKSVGGVDIPYPKFSVGWHKRGGIFTGASVIGVGEAGSEAVVPLSGQRMKPFAEAVAGEMPQGKSSGSGDMVQVTSVIQLDGREIARATSTHMDGELRRTRDSKSRARGGN